MAADALIRRSIELNQPAAVVAMNYRLGGTSSLRRLCLNRKVRRSCHFVVFSQLGGKEIKEAGVGNLALQDRMRIILCTRYK